MWIFQGVPGLADDAAYEAFFQWREQLYADFRQVLPETVSVSSSGPSRISID